MGRGEVIRREPVWVLLLQEAASQEVGRAHACQAAESGRKEGLSLNVTTPNISNGLWGTYPLTPLSWEVATLKFVGKWLLQANAQGRA